jgi:hypothetical protein
LKGINLSKKKVIVWHTGTRYRTDPEKHNQRWNDIVEKSVIALGEFQNLGAKDPVYCGITVDTDYLMPEYKNNKVITFGHYPSNAGVKGTASILKVIGRINEKYNGKFIFRHDTLKLHHKQQIKRMRQCDVYIEMCATTQGDNPYGSYGTTALEAAALGKVVITNNLWKSLYHNAYGNSALQIANSEDELYATIEKFIKMDKSKLTELKKESRKWVESKHSLKATGEYLLKNILC